jgi:hypothetical protein
MLDCVRLNSALAFLTVVATVFVVRPASAAGKPKPASAPQHRAAPPGDFKRTSTDDLVQQAKQLHEQLEYEQVLPLVQEVLAREGVPIEQTLDAYVLQASCLAIVGNSIDAEGPFRRLLRGRPSFDLPMDTPPKILSVFRRVQAEERAISEQMEVLTRGRIIKEMALIGAHPDQLKGGRSIAFDYTLQDPSVTATAVRVQYRKAGEPSYSSLALLRDAAGRWRGQIPAEWTANDGGTALEMYIEALDDKGPLLVVGTAGQPMVRAITTGQVDRSAPPPLSPWAVWTGSGATAVLLAGGAAFGAVMASVQADYRAQASLAATVPQNGSEMRQKRELGEILSLTANGLFVASAVAGVSTLVAGAFFTDWEPGDTDNGAAPQVPAR